MSIVSFLGGYSAIVILSDENNIDLDYDYDGNLFDVNDTSLRFKVDFKFRNVGYFDLEDLEVEFKVYVRYWHENYTTPGVSTRRDVMIYEAEEDFGDVGSGMTLRDNIKIERNVIIGNVTDIYQNVDTNPPDDDPIASFIAKHIIITGKYSLGLIRFRVEIDKYTIKNIELEDWIP
jgi:hypothetical protein